MSQDCDHLWDGPRIQLTEVCSIATCSKCGAKPIEIETGDLVALQERAVAPLEVARG